MFSRKHSFTLLFDADNGAGSGGGDPNPAPPTQPDPKPDVKAQVAAAVADLLARHKNDPTEALTTLIRQNHTQSAEITRLQGQLPSEADKTDLAAFRALGKPDELKQQVEDGRTAISERDTLKRDEIFQQAATIEGYNPDVFKDLARDKQLQVAVKDGKAVVTLTVDGKAVEKPLGEFVQSDLAGYVPALAPTRQGTRVITQRGGDGASAPPDLVQKRLDEKAADRNARPNPLMAPPIPTAQPPAQQAAVVPERK